MHPRVRLTLMAGGALALVAALAVALAARGSDDGTDRGFAGATRPAIPVADFALRNQDGTLVRSRSTRGRVTVVTFLYSTCRDTCPIMATTIAQALDRLGHDIPVLAVSVDPSNDTPALARAFLAKRLLQKRMSFLLGTQRQLEPVWDRFGIRPQEDGLEHSSYVVLLDRQGRQRIGFPADRLTAEGLAHDIRRLEGEPRRRRATAA